MWGRIKITRRRKILGEDFGGKKRKSDAFYLLFFTKEKSIQPCIKHCLFISKTFHTFVWPLQLKNYAYVTLHLFFSTCSGQSRKFRSAKWKSFLKNKSCIQYLPLYLCNSYLAVLKLLYVKMEIQGPFICYF